MTPPLGDMSGRDNDAGLDPDLRVWNEFVRGIRYGENLFNSYLFNE